MFWKHPQPLIAVVHSLTHISTEIELPFCKYLENGIRYWEAGWTCIYSKNSPIEWCESRVCADTPYTRTDGSGLCFCKYLKNGIWYWKADYTCFSRSIIRVEWYGPRLLADTPYIKTWNFRFTKMRFEICTLSDVVAQFAGHHKIGRPHNTLRPRGCELRACGWAVRRYRRHCFGVTEKSRKLDVLATWWVHVLCEWAAASATAVPIWSTATTTTPMWLNQQRSSIKFQILASPTWRGARGPEPGANQNLGFSAAQANLTTTTPQNRVFTTITTDARSDASKRCFSWWIPMFLLSFRPHRDLTHVYQITKFNVASLFVSCIRHLRNVWYHLLCTAVQSLQPALWWLFERRFCRILTLSLATC